MPTPYDTARQHAHHCAAAELCTTAELFSRVANYQPETARQALKAAADAGYLRAGLLPGFGNKLSYQPTAKAAGRVGRHVPKFLRAGLHSDARMRGLLRGYVAVCAHPGLAYLSVAEQSALCQQHGVIERGYGRALAGLDGEHYRIFVPVLPSEAPFTAIEAASARWLPLLDTGGATLHFVAVAGPTADGLRDAAAAINPTKGIKAELAAIDAELAADRTGLAVVRLAIRRAAMAAELAATAGHGYQWLGEVLGADL